MLSSNRQEMLKNVWCEYTSGEEVLSGEIRQIILDSWERCKKWGVNHRQTQVDEVISFHELDKRCETNRDLINELSPLWKSYITL